MGAEPRLVTCPPCQRCGWPYPDVFLTRSGRRLCVVCMGHPYEYALIHPEEAS